MKHIHYLLLVLITALVLVGCMPGAQATPDTLTDEPEPTVVTPPTEAPVSAEDDNDLLLTVYQHGGLCVYGGECQWTLTIYENGSYETLDGSGATTQGTLTVEQMTELRDL